MEKQEKPVIIYYDKLKAFYKDGVYSYGTKTFDNIKDLIKEMKGDDKINRYMSKASYGDFR